MKTSGTSGPITGKVAKILNTHQVALNIGTNHGVDAGMVFKVIDTIGQSIVDPDTGDAIGDLNLAKMRFRITQVLPALSVATTFSKRVRTGGGPTLSSLVLGYTPEPPKWVKEYESLREDNQVFEPLDEMQSVVKVGDEVVQVIKRTDSAEATHNA